MARQDSRHRSWKGQWKECTYSSEIGTVKIDSHDTRMFNERLPKKILYGELKVGRRSHDGQKKRYRDTLRPSTPSPPPPPHTHTQLKDFNLSTGSLKQIAQDRAKWRGLIRRGAGEFEAKRISEAEQKRSQRNARAKASPTKLSSSDFSCIICNRQFRAKTGLISHLRTHNDTSHIWIRPWQATLWFYSYVCNHSCCILIVWSIILYSTNW